MYCICIAYFVLFQIILIYVQVLLSITLLEQCSDAVYAIFWAGCAKFLPLNAKTLFFLHFAVNWHIQLVIVWHNTFCIDGSCFVDTNFEKLLLCNVFVCTFCMCYLLHFFRLWSIRQKKKHCQRQSGPRVEFSLRK